VTASPASTVIVARGSRDYRWRRYLFAAIVLGMGLYFAYDGWIGWPQRNTLIRQALAERDDAQDRGDSARVAELSTQLKALGDIKNDASILLQKLLGVGLPPLAVALLVMWVYRSRGAYVLDTDAAALRVPGHGVVELQHITQLDKSQWNRKGIAIVHYSSPGARPGRLVLDDFVYQRRPTDQIVEHVEQHIAARKA
jgi:hypothetical protein